MTIAYYSPLFTLCHLPFAFLSFTRSSYILLTAESITTPTGWYSREDGVSWVVTRCAGEKQLKGVVRFSWVQLTLKSESSSRLNERRRLRIDVLVSDSTKTVAPVSYVLYK